MLLLIEHLDREVWAPHLVCQGGALASRASALDVEVSAIEMPRLRRSASALTSLSSGARRIAAEAARIDAALVHTNTVRATLYGVAGARLARRPCVWHLRDLGLVENQPRRPMLDQLAKRVIASGCAEVVVNSRATAAAMPGGAAVSVVHNAVPVDWWSSVDPADFRREHGLEPAGPVVGTVGRLRRWKGQDSFLRTMAKVGAAVPNARFLVVGGTILEPADDYGRELRELAAELGLADRVVFTGHLDDVRPALAAMDVFVHAGSPEPFGLVNIEAMAAGLPVVAFAHGGLPEIVESDRTGLLVPPGDEDALADAVATLLADPARRAEMGRLAAERALLSFSPERMASDVAAVWTRALALRPPTSPPARPPSSPPV